ncbi:MAG: hypothetical protein LBS53_04750 [Synergistaceae bacterium]|jgi:tetratricopeptide (TPR) repeat protein|nr:hypothetical protein [Synergistaceae bacterium]
MTFKSRRFSCVEAFFVLAVLLAAFVPPASAAGLHDRAKNLYDVGDYYAAFNLYERILRDDPNDGLAWDISAWCLRYLGDAKSAEANYKKALLLLKGENAIWSFIGLGELYIDNGRYEDALVKLREAKGLAAENEEAAERTARDIEIAEKALAEVPSAASDDTAEKKTEMTDADDRRAKALLEEHQPKNDAQDAAPVPESDDIVRAVSKDESPAKAAKPKGPASGKTAAKPAPKKPVPKPKPEKTPRPPRNDVIYGVKLGSPITEALESLKKLGCQIGEAPFESNGKKFYSVTGLKANLPGAITSGAARRRFYIVSSGGAVLSVNVELDYDVRTNFDAIKDAARGEIGNISGLGGTRGLVQVSNIFSFEMNLAVSNTYGVSMLVVDRGNGTSRLEIQHIDLYGLSNYWSKERKE